MGELHSVVVKQQRPSSPARPRGVTPRQPGFEGGSGDAFTGWDGENKEFHPVNAYSLSTSQFETVATLPGSSGSNHHLSTTPRGRGLRKAPRGAVSVGWPPRRRLLRRPPPHLGAAVSSPAPLLGPTSSAAPESRRPRRPLGTVGPSNRVLTNGRSPGGTPDRRPSRNRPRGRGAQALRSGQPRSESVPIVNSPPPTHTIPGGPSAGDCASRLRPTRAKLTPKVPMPSAASRSERLPEHAGAWEKAGASNGPRSASGTDSDVLPAAHSLF